MIVTSVQHLVDYVRENFRTRIYRTIQDPVTNKEIVTCEVYTIKGKVEHVRDKGHQVDKKI